MVEHDVEHLEHENGDRRPDDRDRAPDLRHHDACQKICQPLAPSMTAASMVSSGMPRSAADRMTIAKPVWIQIRMTIRKKLFQKGTDDPHLRRRRRSSWTIAFSRPICTSLPRRDIRR